MYHHTQLLPGFIVESCPCLKNERNFFHSESSIPFATSVTFYVPQLTESQQAKIKVGT
jgi:hypothetical protein